MPICTTPAPLSIWYLRNTRYPLNPFCLISSTADSPLHRVKCLKRVGLEHVGQFKDLRLYPLVHAGELAWWLSRSSARGLERCCSCWSRVFCWVRVLHCRIPSKSVLIRLSFATNPDILCDDRQCFALVNGKMSAEQRYV